jgi:drug/metabolite transporter (DMT)-like permease
LKALSRNDLELSAVVLFWGFNFVAIKVGLREVEPLAYNAVRFVCASTILLLLARSLEGTLAVRREDLGRLVLLGFLGHAVYQICFIEGLARTTASSAAIIFGSTPVVVGLLSRLAGHERIGPLGFSGALLGFFGIYLIVEGGDAASIPPADGELLGNILIVGAVLCWSTYTVLARDLLQRYSPLRITAITLPIGAVFLVPAALPQTLRQDWGGVSTIAWAGIVYSFLFALVISYVLWYRSVKQVGNLRTAVYSNLVPVFGTLFGVLLLDERLTTGLGLGAACILGGIVLTRVNRLDPVRASVSPRRKV